MNKTTDSLLDDWAKIVYLYSIVDEFANQYKNGKVLANPTLILISNRFVLQKNWIFTISLQ